MDKYGVMGKREPDNQKRMTKHSKQVRDSSFNLIFIKRIRLMKYHNKTVGVYQLSRLLEKKPIIPNTIRISSAEVRVQYKTSEKCKRN